MQVRDARIFQYQGKLINIQHTSILQGKINIRNFARRKEWRLTAEKSKLEKKKFDLCV